MRIILVVVMFFAVTSAMGQTCDLTAKPGDGFQRIAQRCNLNANELIQANRAAAWYRSENFIPRGAVLTAPGTTTTATTQPQQDESAVVKQNGDLQKKIAELTNEIAALKKANGVSAGATKLQQEIAQLKEQIAKQGGKSSPDAEDLKGQLGLLSKQKADAENDSSNYFLMLILGLPIAFVLGIGVKSLHHWSMQAKKPKKLANETIFPIAKPTWKDKNNNYLLPISLEQFEMINGASINTMPNDVLAQMETHLPRRLALLMEEKQSLNDLNWFQKWRNRIEIQDNIETIRSCKEAIGWVNQQVILRRNSKTTIVAVPRNTTQPIVAAQAA